MPPDQAFLVDLDQGGSKIALPVLFGPQLFNPSIMNDIYESYGFIDLSRVFQISLSNLFSIKNLTLLTTSKDLIPPTNLIKIPQRRRPSRKMASFHKRVHSPDRLRWRNHTSN